jgi:hypothetical protein
MDIHFSDQTAYISGTIDEHADFSPVLQQPGPLTLDLSGVKMVNSLGVRGWLKFLFDWGTRSELTYDKCSVAVVDQLVILESLTKPKDYLIKIRSFYAPIECTSCTFSSEILVSYADLARAGSIDDLLPKCAACGGLQQCSAHGHQNLI